MNTGTTTNHGKLGAGYKRFHRLAMARGVSKKTGRVLVLDIASHTQFSEGVFPDCEEHRATVEYDIKSTTVHVHVEGRNLGDFHPPEQLVVYGFSLGERTYKAWPYHRTTTINLRDMPLQDVSFLTSFLK